MSTFEPALATIFGSKLREKYRRAFDDFDPNKVANYDQRMIQELLTYPTIIQQQFGGLG